MSQLREADVHAETLRRGEQEGGHSGPPNGGLENLPSVGNVAQTELGRLPADWRVGRFDSLFDVQQGRQVSKKNRIGDNQRPFLRTRMFSGIAWICPTSMKCTSAKLTNRASP